MSFLIYSSWNDFNETISLKTPSQEEGRPRNMQIGKNRSGQLYFFLQMRSISVFAISPLLCIWKKTFTSEYQSFLCVENVFSLIVNS